MRGGPIGTTEGIGPVSDVEECGNGCGLCLEGRCVAVVQVQCGVVSELSDT